MKIWQWVPAYNAQLHYSIVSQLLADRENFDALVAEARERGRNTSDWEWSYKANHGCDLVLMRNKIVDDAIRAGVDYLLMQDADVFATQPPLMRLLNAAIEHDATAVYAMVLMRTRPIKANVWPSKPGEVYECRKAGTGMVLIDLNKIREWYDDYDGPLFVRLYSTRKIVKQEVGLDLFFSHLVAKQGGKLWCEGTIPTVHVDTTQELAYDGFYLDDDYLQSDSAPTEESDSASPEVASAAQA